MQKTVETTKENEKDANYVIGKRNEVEEKNILDENYLEDDIPPN